MWVFIVLVAVLTTTYVLYKIQPSSPPTRPAEKATWLKSQVGLGFMEEEILTRGEIYEGKFFKNDENIFGQKITREMQEAIYANYKYYKIDYTIWSDYDSPSVTNMNRRLLIYREIPIMVQYGKWVKNVVTKFDWGPSTNISINEKATTVLNRSFPYTIGVNLITTLIEIPLGLFFGILCAIKKDSIFDNIINVVFMVFISLPGFVVIMLLMKWFGSDHLFGLSHPLLPYQWQSSDAPTKQKILAYFIPVISLSLGGIAGLTRSVRAELSEGLTQDYVLLARTKGLSKQQAINRHALRIALTPLLPGLIFSFAALLGGAGITEQVYGIPGAGRVFLQAIQGSQPDYNVLMYDTALFSFLGLFLGILMDMSYSIIDPRIRMGAKNE
jgi:oligopeptide transport system permease protein